MKLITAVIRPDRLATVKESLFEAGVTGITIMRVSGHGGEREMLEQYRGSRFLIEFHEKVQLEIAVSEEFVEMTIQAIIKGARTGEVGDGKIFVQAIERVVRIRNGDENQAAVTPVAAATR